MLDNKLGINFSTDLALVEERISKKKAVMLFANGYEEVEALMTVDLLKRAGVDIRLVSINDDMTVTGSHGISVTMDTKLSRIQLKEEDAIIIPGGMPGTKYLEKYKSTPNQRLELDASRDATALLHRQTSPNYKTSLTVPIRKLYLGEKIVVKAIIDAGIVSGGLTVIIWDYIPFINGQTLGTATGLYSLATGFVISILCIVIFSLCTKAPEKEILEEFDRVKKMKEE